MPTVSYDSRNVEIRAVLNFGTMLVGQTGWHDDATGGSGLSQTG